MENWLYYVVFGAVVILGAVFMKFAWPKLKDKVIFKMAQKFIEEAKQLCADGKCETIKEYALDALQAWADKWKLKIDVDSLARAVIAAFEFLTENMQEDDGQNSSQDADTGMKG